MDPCPRQQYDATQRSIDFCGIRPEGNNHPLPACQSNCVLKIPIDPIAAHATFSF
jgi:hypothetical protein